MDFNGIRYRVTCQEEITEGNEQGRKQRERLQALRSHDDGPTLTIKNQSLPVSFFICEFYLLELSS